MQPEQSRTERQLDKAHLQLEGDCEHLRAIWVRLTKTQMVLQRANEVYEASRALLLVISPPSGRESEADEARRIAAALARLPELKMPQAKTGVADE